MTSAKSHILTLGDNSVFIVATVLFLVPVGLLAAAWRQYFRGAVTTQIPRWRSFSGIVALLLASLATVLELVFFFSWFHNGGSPHGMMPSFGIWKFIGRIAYWTFLTSILLTFFGKGKWRVLVSAWVVSVCLVVPLIFTLEMD